MGDIKTPAEFYATTTRDKRIRDLVQDGVNRASKFPPLPLPEYTKYVEHMEGQSNE